MEKVIKENASDIVEDLVEQRGLKKSFIAKKIGTSPQNLTNTLHRGSINADIAFKLAKALDISPRIFFNEAYANFLKE